METFAYFVLTEDMFLGFHEFPEDAYDVEEYKVYKLVSAYDINALQPGYGERIDEVTRQHPEIQDSDILDSYRMKIEVTVGWLRSINCLAGFLQQELRVRNPDMSHFFKGREST